MSVKQKAEEAGNKALGKRLAQVSPQAESLAYSYEPSVFGTLLVASRAEGIAAIIFGATPDQAVASLQAAFPNSPCLYNPATQAHTLAQVAIALREPHACVPLKLDIRGTAFQRRVWEALRDIPAGTTMTYKELAAHVGAPTAIRAVATACGANQHAVVVPCHRVIGSNKKLTGYRWGLAVKEALLASEAATLGQVRPYTA